MDREYYLTKIEQRLDVVLTPQLSNEYLIDAMRYVVLGGAKRLRPLLVLAGGEVNNANEGVLTEIGCAIELIHCYSLVHDDLPSMDNDDLRRGKLTCHKKYDEATAILVGDALLSLAFSILSSDALGLAPQVQLKIVNMIATSSGINGLVGGQVLDLQATGVAIDAFQLQKLHLLKTGALIKASLLSGYLCGVNYTEKDFAKLAFIADKLGLIFQIVDDILDVTASSEQLGKTANKDIMQNKSTYVNLFGLNKSRDIAQTLYKEIVDEILTLVHHSLLLDISTTIYKRNH